MNFVDEEHVVGLEVREDGREVARALENRSRGLAQMHAHFVGDDVCERGLSEPGRSEEEQMVERFAALARRTDEDVELFAHGLLAHVLGKMRRAQGAVDVFFVGALRGGIDDAFVHDKHSLSGEHFEGLYRTAFRCRSIVYTFRRFCGSKLKLLLYLQIRLLNLSYMNRIVCKSHFR